MSNYIDEEEKKIYHKEINSQFGINVNKTLSYSQDSSLTNKSLENYKNSAFITNVLGINEADEVFLNYRQGIFLFEKCLHSFIYTDSMSYNALAISGNGEKLLKQSSVLIPTQKSTFQYQHKG